SAASVSTSVASAATAAAATGATQLEFPPVARRSGFLRQCLSEVLEFRSELCRHAGRLDEIFVETFRFFSIVWNAWVVACFEVEQLPLPRPMLSSSQTSSSSGHSTAEPASLAAYFSRDLLTAVMNGLQCAACALAAWEPPPTPASSAARATASTAESVTADAASAELLDSLVHDLGHGVFAFLYIACQRSLDGLVAHHQLHHLLSLMTAPFVFSSQSAQPANIRDMVRMRNEEAIVRGLARVFEINGASGAAAADDAVRCPRSARRIFYTSLVDCVVHLPGNFCPLWRTSVLD
uniref:Peptidase_M3 domain-containing protein n=1 Tax=Macrostomum lignano TaxID=282301 RepID=A0A1I8IQV6_9PLAT